MGPKRNTFGPERKLLERIIKHMEKQGQFATSSKGGCVYRRELGKNKKVLRCGVGCLIPKSLYNPKIEGASVRRYYLSNEAYEALRQILTELDLIQHQQFLTKMQALHDNSFQYYGVTFDQYLDKLRALRNVYV